MEKPRRRHVSILGPVLLIAAGIVLLLNTLGVLSWDIWWNILRLWPILLIAAGLDLLIGRRSALGALVAAVLILAVFVGALWLTESHAGSGGLTTQEIRQPLGDATQAEVTIQPGVAVLQLKALPESASLVEGTVHLGSGEKLAEDYSQKGNTAVYTLKTQEGTGIPLGTGWEKGRTWDLGLSPGAALQLQTSMGVGQAVLDLTGLSLSDLKVSSGVGQTQVTLPAKGRFKASIEQAIGQLVIIVPKGMALHVKADTALAGHQLPSGLQDEGQGVWTSPGFATAENSVNLETSVAIGNLTIRYGE
jgi:LiaI-LiaF-like transmembrane region